MNKRRQRRWMDVWWWFCFPLPSGFVFDWARKHACCSVRLLSGSPTEACCTVDRQDFGAITMSADTGDAPTEKQVYYRIVRLKEWLAQQDPAVVCRLSQMPNPCFFTKRKFETELCNLRDAVRQIAIEVYFEVHPNPLDDENELLMVRRCLMMIKDRVREIS